MGIYVFVSDMIVKTHLICYIDSFKTVFRNNNDAGAAIMRDLIAYLDEMSYTQIVAYLGLTLDDIEEIKNNVEDFLDALENTEKLFAGISSSNYDVIDTVAFDQYFNDLREYFQNISFIPIN